MPIRRIGLIFSLIAFGILSRLIPHPPNFTAIGAASVLSGALLGKKRQSWLVPLFSMLLSDALLGFHSLMPVVYLNIVLTISIGQILTSRSSTFAYAGAGIISSLLFFLSTNFAVWLQGGLYPRTAEGLVTCYVAAIPFLKNMIFANVLYVTLIITALRLIEHISPDFRMPSKHVETA